MRTIGLKPGDWVLVLERRDERVLVHNGVAVRLSMLPELAGSLGEMSIELAFVSVHDSMGHLHHLSDVVHVSHSDWLEARVGLAYEEMPGPVMGVCRFCRCTQQRACAGGCAWLDLEGTVCSAPDCREKLNAEIDAESAEVVLDN